MAQKQNVQAHILKLSSKWLQKYSKWSFYFQIFSILFQYPKISFFKSHYLSLIFHYTDFIFIDSNLSFNYLLEIKQDFLLTYGNFRNNWGVFNCLMTSLHQASITNIERFSHYQSSYLCWFYHSVAIIQNRWFKYIYRYNLMTLLLL